MSTMINPWTGRRIKIGGRTYIKVMNGGGKRKLPQKKRKLKDKKPPQKKRKLNKDKGKQKQYKLKVHKLKVPKPKAKGIPFDIEWDAANKKIIKVPKSKGKQKRPQAGSWDVEWMAAHKKIEKMTGKMNEALNIIKLAKKKLLAFATDRHLRYINLKHVTPRFIKGFNMFIRAVKQFIIKVNKIHILSGIEITILNRKIGKVIKNSKWVANTVYKLCEILDDYNEELLSPKTQWGVSHADADTKVMIRRGQKRCLVIKDMITEVYLKLKHLSRLYKTIASLPTPTPLLPPRHTLKPVLTINS